MKTIQSILYATDFSPQSQAAFPLPVALAHDSGARLVVAHVRYRPMVVYSMGEGAIIEPEENTEQLRERLR